MPNRWRPAESKIVYAFLVQRDGETCRMCGKRPEDVAGKQKRLEIDHIDHNRKNDAPENLRLLCPNDNKHAEAKALRVALYQSINHSAALHRAKGHVPEAGRSAEGSGGGLPSGRAPDGEEDSATDGISSRTEALRRAADYSLGPVQMQVNNLCETQFRAWVRMTLRDRGPTSSEELVSAGAEEVGCSRHTAREYLAKMLSFRGQLGARISENKHVVSFKDQAKASPPAAPATPGKAEAKE